MIAKNKGKPPKRSARMGLRATPEQEALLRRAAEVSRRTITEFVLEAACLAAEERLLDQRLFMVSGSRARELLEVLDRPEQANPRLAELFARSTPWTSP